MMHTGHNNKKTATIYINNKLRIKLSTEMTKHVFNYYQLLQQQQKD
jgi:hypothetical protein